MLIKSIWALLTYVEMPIKRYLDHLVLKCARLISEIAFSGIAFKLKSLFP